MFSKLFGIAVLIGLTISGLVAQKTPEEKKRTEAQQGFYLAYGGGESYLGIYPEDVSKDNFGKYGLREVRGVAVTKVEENSPAAKAGLLAGDVIIKFNGDEVTSWKKLSRLIGEVAPDHKAEIKVLRNGQEMEFTAVLEKRKFESFNGAFTFEAPKMPQMPKIEVPRVPVAPNSELTLKGDGQFFYFGSSRQIGVGTSSLTKQLGDYFGVADGQGLLITSVRENSPAAKAGLRAGDVIVEVEGKKVKNHLDLSRAIIEKKEGEITLTIVRDKNRQTLRVTPEEIKGETFPVMEGNFPAFQIPKVPTVPVNLVKPLELPRVIL